MTINSILSEYGFQKEANGRMVWGVGSLMWGHLMYVQGKGKNLYEVKYHTWYYDCDGEEVYDTTETNVMHGAQVLEFAFSHLPKTYLFRARR